MEDNTFFLHDYITMIYVLCIIEETDSLRMVPT